VYVPAPYWWDLFASSSGHPSLSEAVQTTGWNSVDLKISVSVECKEVLDKMNGLSWKYGVIIKAPFSVVSLTIHRREKSRLIPPQETLSDSSRIKVPSEKLITSK
jgi:hypothetical protein